jgi:hypothetical protein
MLCHHLNVACRSQAPEVGNFTDQQLNTALCDAAKRTGGVEPIDVWAIAT